MPHKKRIHFINPYHTAIQRHMLMFCIYLYLFYFFPPHIHLRFSNDPSYFIHMKAISSSKSRPDSYELSLSNNPEPPHQNPIDKKRAAASAAPILRAALKAGLATPSITINKTEKNRGKTTAPIKTK